MRIGFTQRLGARTMVATLMPMALVALMPVALPLEAFAQDVYNFYFQKSPSGESAPEPRLPQASVETKVKDRDDGESSDDEPKWSVNIGYGTFADEEKIAEGWTLGAEYSLSRYVALQGQLMTGQKVSSKIEYQWHEREREATSAALGVKITPIHMSLFGWNLLEISGLAGIMTMTRLEKQRHHTPSPAWQFNSDVHGFETYESRRRKEALVPYLGVGVALNLDKRLSAIAQAKAVTEGERYYHVLFAGAYRF